MLSFPFKGLKHQNTDIDENELIWRFNELGQQKTYCGIQFRSNNFPFHRKNKQAKTTNLLKFGWLLSTLSVSVTTSWVWSTLFSNLHFLKKKYIYIYIYKRDSNDVRILLPLSVQICAPTSIKLCEIIFYLNCWFCFECSSHSYLLVCLFPSPSSICTVSCLLVFIRCSSFLLNAELVGNFLNLCFYFPQNNRQECWCDSNREYALIAIRYIFSFISFVFMSRL